MYDLFQAFFGGDMMILKKLTAVVLSAAVMTASQLFGGISAAAAGYTYMYLGSVRIAKVAPDGTVFMINQNDAHQNGRVFNCLLNNNKKYKIVFPAQRIETDRGMTIGSNKTIVATGATIYQVNPQKQLINNKCTKLNYASIQNVSITGGKWEIADNAKMLRDTSTVRFNHGQNISLKNMTVMTNYRSHGIEVIACRNMTISGCRVLAEGTPSPTSLEEAVQIDLASPATAPTVAAFGDKYVQGQTCYNITVENCTIRGARGLCCNKTATENKRFYNCYHRNIVVRGNDITGVTSEALCMHNTYGVSVENNKIVSKGSRVNTTYSIGINVASFGNVNCTSMRNVISGNTVYGGLYGICVRAQEGSTTFGATYVKNNTIYCKKGTKNCKYVRNCKSYTATGNKIYKWQ